MAELTRCQARFTQASQLCGATRASRQSGLGRKGRVVHRLVKLFEEFVGSSGDGNDVGKLIDLGGADGNHRFAHRQVFAKLERIGVHDLPRQPVRDQAAIESAAVLGERLIRTASQKVQIRKSRQRLLGNGDASDHDE